MYLVDYILPQVTKLSHALQTKHLDLSLISSLVDATLNSLDDAILPSANWVLQLQDAREELKAATGIEVTHLDALFKKEWASLLSDSSKITYPAGLDPRHKMCYQPSVFFIQRKCPASLLKSYLYMATVQFKLSLDSLGEIPSKSLEGTEFEKAAIVSSDLSTEWKAYCQLLIFSQKMIYLCN